MANIFWMDTLHAESRTMANGRHAVILAAVVLYGTVSIACSETGIELLPTRIYQVIKPFVNDEGDLATNISGLACLPADDSRSTCIVVDDEGRFAQIAIVGNGQITAGARLPLIGTKLSRDTVGQPPVRVGCSGGNAKFKDMDGEAAAYSSSFFYVVGSHGCSRHGNKFRRSAFILARIPKAQVVGAASGRNSVFDASSVQTTYRLSEAMVAVPQIQQYFTRDLTSANGLNIEGLAVDGRKLYAGLRAPVLDGNSFIVEVDVEKLFDETSSISKSDVRAILAPLGPNRGIRDLAWLKNGRLLILSGPAQDAKLPFDIQLLDIATGTITLMGTLPELTDAAGAKAEAISVLSQDGNAIDVLVMFDGLENGGPREYRILLK
jgi:hypothetical protein